MFRFRHYSFAALLSVGAGACLDSPRGETPPTASSTPAAESVRSGLDSGRVTAVAARPTEIRIPNELGRIPIIEYHLIGDKEGRWERSRQGFRDDLESLYRRGYRPVTVAQILDRKIDLPRGMSPVVIVFDDASPGQFSYIERNGNLEIDPESAVGMLLDFNRRHRDWANAAVFCLLSGASQGRSFFGDTGVAGQKSEWRFPKVRFLVRAGFELCAHTLWHANLGAMSDAMVQEQIARGVMAIDSAVPGYDVRTFALPLGVWPKNRALAKSGSWQVPRSGRAINYDFDAILRVAGGPARSPYDPEFDPLSIPRVQVFGNELEKWLNQLDRSGTRYVSDGDSRTVARRD
jgi:peptidoglycan/xylan/chitin deacetylase (PgdA/CDA1 family)